VSALPSRHEAAHAASLSWAGMPPLRVVTNYPDADTAGRTTPDWQRHSLTKDTVTAFLVAVVMGALFDNVPKATLYRFPVDPEAWPSLDSSVAPLLMGGGDDETSA
jgi:hypothetical protein